MVASRGSCAGDGGNGRVRQQLTCKTSRMIKFLLVAGLFFLLATFPATWLLMLFLGNVGLSISYWGALPLGILVSALLSGASTSRTYV